MTVEVEKKYMQRCLQLAQNGLGTTYPNPLVGSVIVCNDKILGEGWHQKSGNPHAEVHAINSVQDKSLLKKATLYVNLEPCNHFGKTPPCSDLILDSGIPKIVIGIQDPFAQVAGAGIAKLQEAGREVVVGVLLEASRHINRRFFTYHEKKRPYIILKWAESCDGFISPLAKEEQKPVWISNVYSRQWVHKWRSEEQAILVGTKTVFDDNPRLNVRTWTGHNPTRIILDRECKIPLGYHVWDDKVKTIVFTEKNRESRSKPWLLKEDPQEIGYHDSQMVPAIPGKKQPIYERIAFSNTMVQEMCTVLYHHHIQSVLIEGGTKTIQTFIDADIWDEARIFVGSSSLGEGMKAPVLNRNGATYQAIGDDGLFTLYK